MKETAEQLLSRSAEALEGLEDDVRLSVGDGGVRAEIEAVMDDLEALLKDQTVLLGKSIRDKLEELVSTLGDKTHVELVAFDEVPDFSELTRDLRYFGG